MALNGLLDGLGVTNLDITLNRGPVAVNDTGSANLLGSLTFVDAAQGVLANDSDPDGDALSVVASGAGTYGNLTLNPDGSYTYLFFDPSGPTGSHPHDVIQYQVSDGHGGLGVANLDITLNRGPVAANDIAGVAAKGGSVSSNVLSNDADSDGDAILVTGINGGSLGQSVSGQYGELLLNANGSYGYSSNADASLPSQGPAQDTFTYTESDGHGGTAKATLTINAIPDGQNYVGGTPGQTIATGNSKTIIDASLGHQIVGAGNGADTLIGGPNDVL